MMLLGSRPVRAKSGINLAEVNYYTRDKVFLDLFKQSSYWVSNVGYTWDQGPALTLDANGYPSNINEGVNNAHAVAVLLIGEQYPAGTQFQVTYTGPASALVVDGSTQSGGVFTWAKPSVASTNFLVRVFKNGVSNIQVIEVGYPNTQRFRPDFIARNQRYSVLRFMDWHRTNYASSPPILWSNRTQENARTQDSPSGASWEMMIDLCNKTGSGGWFCIPHGADDNYVTSLANLILANRQGNWPIYIEHSNEVWNGIFPQYAYANSQTGGMYSYHVLRTKQIGTLMRATGLKIELVLGLQAAGYATAKWELRDKASPLNTSGIDCFAIAPYFSHDGGSTVENTILSGGVPAALSVMGQHINTTVATWITEHKQLANSLGKRLIGYEGGQHLQKYGNATLSAIYLAANRDVGMYDLYKSYLDLWDGITGDLMCLFSDVYNPQESGYWGLQEYAGQSLGTAHKYRSYLDWLTAEKQ